MSFVKKIIWHDYKAGRASHEEFLEYLQSLPDTNWKAHNLERLAKEHQPEHSTTELTMSEPPTLEASRLDGTTTFHLMSSHIIDQTELNTSNLYELLQNYRTNQSKLVKVEHHM